MRMLAGGLLLILGITTTGCHQPMMSEPTPPLGQHANSASLTIHRTIDCQYLVYLPSDYRTKKQWPLMLFLHGVGERGHDLNLVKKHGPPKLIDQGKEFPFIVVSPQCPDDQWWDMEMLKVLTDKIIADYAVDPDRVYLTGLSMGGYGTWALAATYPDRFAAIAPVCGGGEPKTVRAFTHIPAWVFHGDADNIVGVEESRRMVEALKAEGGDVKFTVYPGVGHDAWTETYNNPELYEWLLKQKRQPPKAN